VRKGGGRARVCTQPRRPTAQPGTGRASRFHLPRRLRLGRAWRTAARVSPEPWSAPAWDPRARRGNRGAAPVASQPHVWSRLERRGWRRRGRGRRCRGRGRAGTPWSRARGQAGGGRGISAVRARRGGWGSRGWVLLVTTGFLES
jgi:hypothetical protein